ncbi:coniferyl alcohol acyltransferase [Ziziphus jujuba]|uniref:Coniferyl alcohol acyltransferase n=1 Tax=Ziziphus jujuba TaxID=326968 RepID=A0A6P4AC28_ZIZJJ|nr:coniferyl alcohol acyltransferase [Ziziphus jujuba]
MEYSGKEMKVRVRKQEVVAAVLPIQEHWLPMSNLDLLLPPLDVGIFMCYKKPADNGCTSAAAAMNMIGMLKKALVQALVSFYALAGEVVTNSTGEPELLCNNRGVDFVEAYADIQLEQLNLYDADTTIQGKFIPNKKQAGVMAVQVTEFQCGGLVVACTWDHRVADAYSANMFMVSWGEIAAAAAAAHDDKVSLLSGLQPCFRRSLLNPRRPAIIDPSIDRFFIPLNMLPPPSPQPPTADRLVSRIYSVSAHEVKRLQSEASTNSCMRSKLVSFSAFLWKTIAKSAITGKQCKLGIAVDGRTRLTLSSSASSAPIPNPSPNPMPSYFGNVLSVPYGSKPADELIAQPLCWVADAVHEFLDIATTEEHFLGLIDWAEAHRPVTSMAKIYSKGIEDGPAFVVSSGVSFPLSHVDFGWGKPAFWSYTFHWEGDTGYVMPMHSPKGNGDWVVYMRLLKGQLDFLEKQASHVLRPFTFDFLR